MLGVSASNCRDAVRRVLDDCCIRQAIQDLKHKVVEPLEGASLYRQLRGCGGRRVEPQRILCHGEQRTLYIFEADLLIPHGRANLPDCRVRHSNFGADAVGGHQQERAPRRSGIEKVPPRLQSAAKSQGGNSKESGNLQPGTAACTLRDTIDCLVVP